MQRYTVSFRIYGKALRVNVMAVSAADAKHRVADAIIFDKVETVLESTPPPTQNGDDPVEYLKGIFGMK